MGWGQMVAAIVGAANDNKNATDAQNASNQQRQDQQDLLKLQLALYNQGRQDNLGYQVTGNSALNQLAKMYGLSYYNAPINTGNLTMSGGGTHVDRQSKGEWLADPGGFFNGQKSRHDPISFGWDNGGTGSGQVVNPGGSGVGQGTGQNDFSDFYDSPEYRTAYNEAMKGSDRLAAATGRFNSGGHLSDVMRLGSDIGNRYLGEYTGKLLTLSGFGPAASNSNASLGQGFGNQAGRTLTNMSDAAYNGAANAANARSRGLANLGNAFGNMFGKTGQGNAGQQYSWGSGNSGSGDGSIDNWQNWGW